MRNLPLVLIVDDDPTHRKTMDMIADHISIRTVIVGSAAEALVQFRKEKFDLVLMDWVMPDIDGCTCAQEMHRLELASLVKTPVVAVTAKVMPGDKEFCLASGMDDYLPKPFTLEQINSIIEKWTISQIQQPC